MGGIHLRLNDYRHRPFRRLRERVFSNPSIRHNTFMSTAMEIQTNQQNRIEERSTNESK